MAKPKGDARPPSRFPDVQPSPSYEHAVGATYLVETMMQIQQSIGELKSEVANLKSSVDKQGDKLDTISHRMYAAGAVIAVVLTVGGFFLSQIWDGIVTLINMSK